MRRPVLFNPIIDDTVIFRCSRSDTEWHRGSGYSGRRKIGARVITTASAGNHDYVRGPGADEVSDYRAVDFTKVVSARDAVFDPVGGEGGLKVFAVLKPGGRAVIIGSGFTAPESPRDDIQSLRPTIDNRV